MPCTFRLGDDRCKFRFSEAELETGSRCVLHPRPEDEASWSAPRTQLVQQTLNSVIARCAASREPLYLFGVVIPRDVSFGAGELPEFVVRDSWFGGGEHFSNTIFSAHVRFVQCTFRGDTNFSGAHFKGEFDLQATAHSTLDFSKVRFDRSVSIKIATRGGKQAITFNEIRCGDSFTLVPSGNFAMPLEFKNATFGGRFRAEGEYSAGIDCSGSRFVDKMSFAGQARKRFNSKRCHFQSDADFRGAILLGTTDFSETRFEKRARFACQFSGPAQFEDCIFEEQADFSAPDGEKDKNAAFSAIGFRRTHFHGPVWFTNRTFASTANFSGCEFVEAPEFHGATLHQDTRLPSIHAFKDRASENAAAAYRTLRQAMEANNARREEAMFYALEQKTLRRVPGQQTHWENFASVLYDSVSAYGVNFWRPIAWLIVTMLLFGMLYALWISWPVALASQFDGERLANGVVFSLQQVVNPFWIWRTQELPWLTGWPNTLKVVATMESLLTTGLFALSLLALRWRFKRE